MFVTCLLGRNIQKVVTNNNDFWGGFGLCFLLKIKIKNLSLWNQELYYIIIATINWGREFESKIFFTGKIVQYHLITRLLTELETPSFSLSTKANQSFKAFMQGNLNPNFSHRKNCIVPSNYKTLD